MQSFKYLGATITSDGRSSTEIRIRIAQAKNAFSELSNILCNPRISFKTRKRVLGCYITPILKYGSEAWTVNKKATDKMNAVEMWFLRKMLKITYLDRITNEEVLRRAGEKRTLHRNIMKNQATFFGHILRRKQVENVVITGKIEGKRSRGRQREKITDCLCSWLQETPLRTISVVWDRGRYRAMVANAHGQGT